MREQAAKGKLPIVKLFQRPHGYPLIVPEVVCGFSWYQHLRLYRFLKQNVRDQKQVLLFMPTIAAARRYQRLLSVFFPCACITSQTADKDVVIDAFHRYRYDVLLCTTVLERGITIRGVNVAVFHADHKVFQEASLIQMIGRVGRSIEIPSGDGLFLCKRKTEDIRNCIAAIQKMNAEETV